MSNNKYAAAERIVSKALEAKQKEEEAYFANADSGDVAYSAQFSDEEYQKPITVEDILALRRIGEKSINDFTPEEIKIAQKWAYKFYQQMGTKSPFFRAWFGDWRMYDTSKISVVSVPTIDIEDAVLKNGDYLIRDTGWTVHAGSTLNGETRHYTGGERVNVKTLNVIQDILGNSVLFDTVVSDDDSKKKSKTTAFLHKLYSLTEYNGRKYIAVVTVEEFYNETIKDISRKAYNLKSIKIESADGRLGTSSSSPMSGADSTISISDLYSLVKQYDKNFHPGKSVNPALLNEDGTPKVFYHGTDAVFDAFDMSKGRANMDIQGAFFSPWELDASGYGKNVGAYYLSIQNPAPEGIAYKALNRFAGQNNAGVKARDYLISLGYDGVDNAGEEMIAFYPTQIKSATDNIGTFDGSNPDIRYSVDDSNRIIDNSYSNVVESNLEDNEGGGNYEELRRGGNGYSSRRGNEENDYPRVFENGKYEYGNVYAKGKKITRDGFTAEVISSSQETAEQKQEKRQLKAETGFDLFFTTGEKWAKTDSAIFIPDSLFGRETFSIENGIASFTEERIKDLIHEYSIEKGGEFNQNYAKGYVAYISPTDFLSLTATNENFILEDARGKYGRLDLNALRESKETPYLRVDFDNGRVIEHQGRHRMSLLRDAGVNSVAFVVEPIDNSNKYSTEKHYGFSLKGQRFSNGTAPGFVVLDELIPLSPAYRNEVYEKFAGNESDIRYSAPGDEAYQNPNIPEGETERRFVTNRTSGNDNAN